jgi:16S rRNA (guanine966-N2)-methyltransferase
MTRIISGTAGGRRLAVPKGDGTRPTSDRVRESLFSRLESLDAIDGARVLDLYAGSGALGLEAVSRGAASAVLVESDRRAAAVARENARSLGLAATVVADRVERYLAGAADRGERFGLVLVDPPYALPGGALATVLAALPAIVTDDAVVVVERSSRDVPPAWPDGLDALDPRHLGETALWPARAVRPGGA